MQKIKEFLKTTIVGGLVFLVPLVVLALLLRHALDAARKVAAPVASMFPAHEIAGVAVGTIVAALALVVIAFGAGLLARTRTGRRVTQWIGDSLLGNLPQYRVVSTMAEGLAKVEQGQGLRPVLVCMDDAWQLGYALPEQLPAGWAAVFIPQSPTPMSGNVLYVRATRVRPLDIGMPMAAKLVKQLGVGSAETLSGVDLTLVEGD